MIKNFNIGDDIFIFDTCSFAATITEIKDDKIGILRNDLLCWYKIDSCKVEPYSDERFLSTMWAKDYRIKRVKK